MPNSPGSDPTGRLTKDPPSFEKRLPIALALMMLVLLASQYFFKPAPGPKPVKPINDKAASQVTTKPVTTPAIQAATPAPPPSGVEAANAETTNEIDTVLYHVILTNRGAAIKS